MANLYPAQTGPFAISEQWCNADDDDQDTDFSSSDSAVLTANSADPVTVDEAWAGVAISATGTSVLAFGANTITFSGNITLDDITATMGAATVSAANVDVGTDGSLTFSGDATITADIALDGGTIADGGNDVEVVGDFIKSSGTLTSTGAWTFSGTGNLSNSTSSQGFGHLVISGAMTNTGIVFAKKATITGTLGGDTNYLGFYSPSAGWWGAQTGTVNCNMEVQNGDSAPGNNITLTNKKLTISSSTTDSITMDANISTGTSELRVWGTGAGDSMTLDMNGYNMTCGLLRPGYWGANSANGKITLGRNATIAAVTRGNDANVGDEMNLEACNILLSGILDGDNQGTNGITITSLGANIVTSGASGQIKEVTSTGVIHCWGLTDGGNNGPNVCHESSLGGPAANVGCGLAKAA